ncbi:MAG: biopolymer transporter ExbD, partial [Acidobacteriota bacterium]
NDRPRLRVSVSARLIVAVAYAIPAIGGALSSLLLMNMFRALMANESAGIGAVMAGMKEASFPAIASLYLGAICGIAVIIVLVVRMVVQTSTASPPIWFFATGGILCLLPAALFWKAQLLIVEALSPGSSISAAGLGGVGADISQLLMLSLIAAPILVLLLVLASVLPLSSGAGKKSGSLVAAAVIEITLIATAIAIPILIDGPKRQNEIVNLPVNVKYAAGDADIEKGTSMVLTLTSDNKLYERQSRNVDDRVERTETVITNQELPGKIEHSMEAKTPEKRIVYLKCDVNASYENVLQVFDIIRKADIDKVGLVVIGEKDESDSYQTAPVMFEVRLPEPLDKTVGVSSKPVRRNPLILIAMLENDGKLKLNNEDMGTITDSKKLENRLRQVFMDRENNGVFREGTNEIEKTIFLKAPKSSKYGDFIKLVEVVKLTGAQPIAIQFDDVILTMGSS